MAKIIKGLFPSFEKKENTVTAIIAAGGSGSRMGIDFNKLFLSIDERPIIAYTLDAFENCREVDDIIIVASEKDFAFVKEIVEAFGYEKVTSIVTGGATRQESVRRGLSALSDECEIVLIHDGARPLVTTQSIANCIEETRENGAAALGTPVKDTIKLADDDGFIKDTVPRENLYLIQTPQGFNRNLIVDAHNYATQNNLDATDDCKLVEALGKKVTIVPSESSNIKLTTPDDYFIISALLAYRGDFE